MHRSVLVLSKMKPVSGASDTERSSARKDEGHDGEPAEVHYPPLVRNLILRAMCGVYLVAFLSFYVQAEGEMALFGDGFKL